MSINSIERIIYQDLDKVHELFVLKSRFLTFLLLFLFELEVEKIKVYYKATRRNKGKDSKSNSEELGMQITLIEPKQLF